MEPVTLEEAPQKRPAFLLVLCILTFVSTGLGIFSPLFQMIRGTRPQQDLQKDVDILMQSAGKMREMGMSSFAHFYEQMAEMTVEINPHAMIAGLVGLLIVIIGGVSAIMMLQGKRIGFHLYIGYSFLQLISTYFFVSAENVPMLIPIVGAILSGIFILMYSRNLHWMTK